MIIYKDKISTIEYDQRSHNVTYIEKGIINRDLLMDQLKAVLTFSEDQPISSIIADFRNLRGSFKNLFNFLYKTYFPTLKSRGLVCKAFIVSDDIISNHLAELLSNELKKLGIEAAVFSNPRAARNWTEMCITAHKEKKITKLSA